jgi:valyl-tRNA synthetase
MDEGLSRAVREVFVRLYEEGLIYRGNRLINWCPRCSTALAEIEVEYEEVAGTLTSIAYPLADGSGAVVVATTRPETMLGDTGVAVHPADDRYRHLVGRTVRLPLIGREIPIVADEAVDPEFGSGAVKVTPAHDLTDFEIGERHGLDAVAILDAAARVTEAGGRFAGLDRLDARKAVTDALTEAGVVVGAADHRHSVGHCYRCGTVVEPYLSDQWFVAVADLVAPAVAAVEEGRSRFIPARWEKSYFHWMQNLRDWTISRQIWWGHRIPAWYCLDGHTTVARTDPAACHQCGSRELVQDEDVLDTWFSSALFPFSTLGWPDQTEDLERFYPNSILITGFDIIYFWVARMMKMGIHFMGDVPFRDTIIHGLVRDAEGHKMSKSRGNTIDPLDVVDEHGADPLRLALIQAANPGQDVPLDIEWVVGARKFGNKLWNAARFVLRSVDPGTVPAEGGYPVDPGPVDVWVLSRLGQVAERFDVLADQYRFSDAFGLLYNFAWSEVFDWYLEMAKPLLAAGPGGSTRQTLGVVMRDLLKLFHPAIPYVTEELWSHLVGDGFLAGSTWPEVPRFEGPAVMADVQEMIAGVRRFRADQGLSPRRGLALALLHSGDGLEAWALEMIGTLASATVEVVPTEPTTGHTRVVAGGLQGFIPLDGLIDLDAERARLDKGIGQAESDLSRSETKLSNPQFVDRAPAEVVDRERERRREISELLDTLRAQRAAL